MDGDHETTVVLLTALDLEYDSVRRQLTKLRRSDHPAGTVFEVGQLPGAAGRIALAVTGPGNTAAAVVAEHAIAMFRPRAIVLTGIAGALHDDLAIGDILVATKVYAYHSGTVRPDGFIPRPRSWETPHHLDQTARHVHHAGTYRSLLPPGRSPRVFFRPIASGEMVVDTRDHDLARQLRSAYDDAAAVEMEGAGAAHSGHLNGTPVIIVRGISDLADGAKLAADRQGWQPLAAANAAAFAVALAADLTTADPAAFGTAPQPPSQLPAHGAPLFGRQGHLAELDDILLTSAAAHPRIAILTGMAGAGKTALAVDWAYRAAEAFPDGLLYIDARGFGPDPALQAGELLAILLRALGQTRGAEHGTVGERAARLRSALHDRRVLILLDNIGSVVQIRPLLPGGHTCALLITSRERLRGLTVQYGVRSVDVGPLPSSNAVELLHTAIGARAAEDPDGTARLAARCAGLPLALRIAAERITSMPAQDLDSVADQLGGGTALDLFDTGDDPYSAVRTVFSWSYQALSEPSATAFRLLSLHPAKTFALPAAAAQIGVPAARAAVILRGLVNAHLVTEPAVNSYEMHDLVRAHARELCARIDDDRTQTAAVRRMFDQYLHTADRAGRVIMPHRHRLPLEGEPAVEIAFADRASALRWFDLERRHLIDVCGIDHPDLDARRWHLAYVLRDYFYLSKHLDGWLETHRLAVRGCQRLGDRRAEGTTRNNLGRALLETGDLDGATEQYRLAHTLLAAAGDEQGTTDAQVNLASVLRRRGAHSEALRIQRAALAVYQRAGLHRKAGITLRSIARTELHLGQLTEATCHAAQALAQFVDLGLDLDAAQTLNTMARLHLLRGDHERAEATGRLAIEYCRRAGSRYEEGRVLHTLGAVAKAFGDKETARRRWRQALTHLRQLGATDAHAVEADLAAYQP